MFIAAKISYIRFFTAAHIYDFHISTIIILWETLEMRRKYLLTPSDVGKCKTVKRDRVFNAICRKSCQQIVIELNLIYHESINFLLLWTTCPNPFSWEKKKTSFRREVERTTLVPIPNGLSNFNQRLNNNNNNIYLNTIKITAELMWSCILKLKQSLQVNKKL